MSATASDACCGSRAGPVCEREVDRRGISAPVRTELDGQSSRFPRRIRFARHLAEAAARAIYSVRLRQSANGRGYRAAAGPRLREPWNCRLDRLGGYRSLRSPPFGIHPGSPDCGLNRLEPGREIPSDPIVGNPAGLPLQAPGVNWHDGSKRSVLADRFDSADDRCNRIHRFLNSVLASHLGLEDPGIEINARIGLLRVPVQRFQEIQQRIVLGQGVAQGRHGMGAAGLDPPQDQDRIAIEFGSIRGMRGDS